ncbi:MAG TPA: extracellular solute-binding protein [Granulicella sp.]|nr:extracellular solute-binding protein [Granulicella sp.]
MKATLQKQLGISADTIGLGRRELLVRAGWLGLGAALGVSARPLLAAEMATLAVAYAGSMGSVMSGPVKRAVAESLQLELHGQAQGASALAQLIVSGSLRPDAFISVTPGPMLNVLRAGKAEVARPIAGTEMVIAYSPKSRFAPLLRAAAEGKANWWEVLQQPGFRFGRSDPAGDPQGRNIVFTMMLAAKEYRQPDLVEKILGPLVNPQQINMESSVQARMQAGELDAASAYKIQPGPFHLPYIALPKSINLSGSTVHAEHPDVSLTVGGKTYFPEPLIFYVAALNEAANARGAASFTAWLESAEAQGILREYGYDAPGSAPTLRADALHG